MADKSDLVYGNPLVERYSSPEMSAVFSNMTKFSTWRKLWIALAKAEKNLGLDISVEQIAEMEANVDTIDFAAAKAYEKQFRHDVMAHIHAFGDVAPAARPIIHLGATSAYVGDNTDLIQLRDALGIIRQRLLGVIANLRSFALEYKDQPTLGFTHFQPAQLTTVGKRACLWLQDFAMDLADLDHVIASLKFRGVKGTTGTQASFLSLFDGDHEKVKELDRQVSAAFGFPASLGVTGQTYTRKIDSRAAAVLSSICQTISKFSYDIRLLANLKEMEEPFESKQIGSSAMPYKRNPMRSERMSSIARFVISLETSPAFTAATQWFERTLDDSANKRLSIPQMFMGTDAVLRIAINVSSGLVVYPAVIAKHLAEELPFIASENIMMAAVKKGGDRQELHEEIRRLAQEAGGRVKRDGEKNDLIDRIAASSVFDLSGGDLAELMEPSQYVGRAPQQVEEFISAEIDPLLNADGGSIETNAELDV